MKPPKYLYWHTGCASCDNEKCSDIGYVGIHLGRNIYECLNCKAIKYARVQDKKGRIK